MIKTKVDKVAAVILYFIGFIVGCVWGHYEQAPLPYICAGVFLGFAFSLLCDPILDKMNS